VAPRERILISDGPADTAQIAEFERDRRELIRRGLGLGGAVIAIHLEQVAVLAYGAALDSKLLTTGFAKVAARFRDHEQEHADALTTALKDLGGTPPPQATAKDIDAVVKGLGDVTSQADVANFAIELEMAAVAAYYDAHRRLIDAKLLQTGASIMANEAQHLVVLRQAVKQDPVPNAFETGAK
jgi:rubrerythrin